MDDGENKTSGVLGALGAFTIWGIAPIYFKAVAYVLPFEILAHRIAWALVFVTGFLLFQGRLREVLAVLRSPRLTSLLALTATLVAINWLTYIWAVSINRVMDASLGYYINPLLNVVLGSVFLKERLRRPQILAIGLASVGVMSLVLQADTFPWISLTLAGSFSVYGLLRKLTPVKPIVGMQIESLVLTPVAVAYLLYLAATSALAFTSSAMSMLLLVSAGPLTAVPLIFFAYGARSLTLTTLGFFQYIAPTLQFTLAVVAFGEPFSLPYAIAFGCIWTALAIYTFDGHVHAVSRRSALQGKAAVATR